MDERILIGNFVAYPALLKNYLKHFDYQMVYDYRYDTLIFTAIHPQERNCPLLLFSLTSVPYETAVKFAQLLGLVSSRKEDEPTVWINKIPMVQVYHNKTDEADRVILELVKCDLPYFIFPDYRYLILQFGPDHSNDNQIAYSADNPGSLDSVIEAIRTFADKYRKSEVSIAV